MNIERAERWWLVSMSYDERAIAAVAVQESVSAERLHTPVVRFGGETDDVEVVVRFKE